jgi:hypothetical protein
MAGLGIKFDARGAHAANVHAVVFLAGLEKDTFGCEAGEGEGGEEIGEGGMLASTKSHAVLRSIALLEVKGGKQA